MRIVLRRCLVCACRMLASYPSASLSLLSRSIDPLHCPSLRFLSSSLRILRRHHHPPSRPCRYLGNHPSLVSLRGHDPRPMYTFTHLTQSVIAKLISSSAISAPRPSLWLARSEPSTMTTTSCRVGKRRVIMNSSQVEVSRPLAVGGNFMRLRPFCSILFST
jgi:hypothetical protein